jgi:hypothetical protein
MVERYMGELEVTYFCMTVVLQDWFTLLPILVSLATDVQELRHGEESQPHPYRRGLLAVQARPGPDAARKSLPERM